MVPLKALLERVPAGQMLGEMGGWLVGGAVRDTFLGVTPVDFDAAVPDADKRIEELARALGKRPVPFDKKMRVWRFALGEVTLDVAALEGDDIERDTARRDFTLNSAAVNLATGETFDAHGARRDIEQKRVRLISPDNLDEDPLRVLRGYRFVSQLGFTLDSSTQKELAARAARLSEPAPQRTRVELFHLLAGEWMEDGLRAAKEDGVLTAVLPEIEELFTPIDELDVDIWEHTLKAASLLNFTLRNLPRSPFAHQLHRLEGLEKPQNRALYVLAALLHDLKKPATFNRDESGVHFYGHDSLAGAAAIGAARRLRLSRAQGKALRTLVVGHMHPHFLSWHNEPTPRALNRYFRRFGELSYGMVIHAYADALASEFSGDGVAGHIRLAARLDAFQTAQEERAKRAKRLVTGHDLIGLGMKPGPRFSSILNEIEEKRAEGAISTREEALELVNEHRARMVE